MTQDSRTVDWRTPDSPLDEVKYRLAAFKFPSFDRSVVEALLAEIERRDADLTTRSNRMKAAARIRDLENELGEARAQIAARAFKHGQEIERVRELRAQIAAKDAALDALDEAHQITQQNLWQDITELRASLAGKEQEHQDFRLQNDAEWRAKLDHLKAQIAAKDAALPVAYTSQLELKRIANGNMGRMLSVADGDFNVPLYAAPARETK